jgi:hypothetical protein
VVSNNSHKGGRKSRKGTNRSRNGVWKEGGEIGMTICTRGVGPWRVWHPSGVGAGLNLHPLVHPHPTRGVNGRGCGFQSAPVGFYWAPVYSLCTTIFCPKIRGHSKPTLKPVDTRWPTPCQNPQVPETRRVRAQFSTHGCGFSPVSILGRGRFLVNPPRCHP